jgi:hypothetical protein
MVIVNGYICMNCCDIDKARLGQDPHQSTDQLQKQLDRHLDKLALGNFGPAVTFGGSLQAATSDNGPDTSDMLHAAQSPNGTISPSSVNIIV